MIGAKIQDIRWATKEEAEAEGWEELMTVIVLSNGSLLYASRDEEGNGPGAMFGMTDAQMGFLVQPA